LLLPTLAAVPEPVTPPNVPLLDTSAVANAMAINPTKQNVRKRPNFEEKMRRKKLIMKERFHCGSWIFACFRRLGFFVQAKDCGRKLASGRIFVS
jgi:hypothetical protein